MFFNLIFYILTIASNQICKLLTVIFDLGIEMLILGRQFIVFVAKYRYLLIYFLVFSMFILLLFYSPFILESFISFIRGSIEGTPLLFWCCFYSFFSNLLAIIMVNFLLFMLMLLIFTLMRVNTMMIMMVLTETHV